MTQQCANGAQSVSPQRPGLFSACCDGRFYHDVTSAHHLSIILVEYIRKIVDFQLICIFVSVPRCFLELSNLKFLLLGKFLFPGFPAAEAQTWIHDKKLMDESLTVVLRKPNCLSQPQRWCLVVQVRKMLHRTTLISDLILLPSGAMKPTDDTVMLLLITSLISVNSK